MPQTFPWVCDGEGSPSGTTGDRDGQSIRFPFPAWLILGVLLVVPPGASAQSPPVVTGALLQTPGAERLRGHVLATELGCIACHASANDALETKSGPDLSTVASRVWPAHLQRFLKAPSEVKPGTTMPDLLQHLTVPEQEAAATALTHFLATQGSPMTGFQSPDPEAVNRGRMLYHSVGCVACHSPEASLPGSVPLGPLEDKYSIASLTAFLEDPRAARPSGRMPDLRLDHFEATDLAHYLLRDAVTRDTPFVPDPALVRRGREWFTELNCQACHQTAQALLQPTGLPPWPALRADQGCLSDTSGRWPRYPLDEAQRTALRQAIAEADEPWTDEARVNLTLLQINCVACHGRAGLGDIPEDRLETFTGKDEQLGDQGRLPPSLTGVGAKLQAAWLREVLVHGTSVRPYLNTRMPRFGSAAMEPLVHRLKSVDTLPAAIWERVPEDLKPTQTGRQLAGSQGFHCVACHTFRGQSAAPIRALDLMSMAGRLEENWFHHYMSQPQRFAPLTLMPDFWPDGRSTLGGILDGDPGRQRDALWQYLVQGPEAGEPAGLVLEPLQVRVADEAVIIRRAFPRIGKRGIAVGYPAGIHLAFDASLMRLGSVWTGGFIEASGIWRGQGAGTVHPMGRDIVHFPAGPAFAPLESMDAPWPAPPEHPTLHFAFQGYVLDALRRPTFRYAVGDHVLEDRFIDHRTPDGRPFLERTVTLVDGPARIPLHFRVAAGQGLRPASPPSGQYMVGSGLRLVLSVPGTLRDSPDGSELILPMALHQSIVIQYHLPE